MAVYFTLTKGMKLVFSWGFLSMSLNLKVTMSFTLDDCSARHQLINEIIDILGQLEPCSLTRVLCKVNQVTNIFI